MGWLQWLRTCRGHPEFSQELRMVVGGVRGVVHNGLMAVMHSGKQHFSFTEVITSQNSSSASN